MAIARWSPFDELTNLHTTMDRLFGDMFDTGQQQQQGNRGGNSGLTFRLPVDIAENDNSYVIKAPVPGFRPEDVEVTVSNNVLTIRATHREEKEDKKGNYLRREMVLGDLMRQIALPNDARADGINATFDNGVLKLEVPRAPKPQPKRIEVKAAQGQNQGQKQMAGAGASSGQPSNR